MDSIAKKKWENFWYYYKPHVFIGIFIVFFIIITIKDCMENVDPDVTLSYIGLVLQPEQVTTIQQELIDVVEDANGDGKHHILINDLMNEQKLYVIVFAKGTQLLVLEKNFLVNYASNGAFQPLDDIVKKYQLNIEPYPEIRQTAPEEQEEHVYGIPLEGNAFFERMRVDVQGKYLTVLRLGMNPDAKEEALQKNAYAVMNKILSGEIHE